MMRLLSGIASVIFAAPPVYAQVPNLAADLVTAPATATQGARIRVAFSIESIGAPASATYSVLLANGRFRSGAIELARSGPVSLPANRLQPQNVEVELPPRVTGVRTLLVEMDPGGLVPEANENDNLAFAAAETLIVPPSVELSVQAITVSPLRRRPGETVSLSLTLENAGQNPATFPVSVHIGRDSVVTASDREIARFSVSAGPGATVSLQRTITLPADLSAGGWRVGVLLDPDGTQGPQDPSQRARVAAGPELTVVRDELTLLTTSLPDGVLDRPYSVRFEARGGDGQYDYTFTSTLPDGLTFERGDQLLRGRPLRTGDFLIGVQVSSDGRSDRAALTLRVLPSGLGLSVATSSLAVAFQRRPYLHRLLAGGGEPPYTWTIREGRLPAGLSLDPAGRIEGTPEDIGRFELVLAVVDRLGAERTARFVLLVSLSPEVLILTARVEARAGEALDAPLEAVGGLLPLRWREESPAPPGLALTSTGRLRGIPTRVGRWPFQVSATDATTVGSQDFGFIEVDVQDPRDLRITSGPMGEIPRAAVFEHFLTAEGGMPPYVWSLVPGQFLPDGFSLVPGPERDRPEGSAVLVGRATQAGLSAFTVRVEDAFGRRAEQPLVYFVDEPQGDASAEGCRVGAEAPSQPPTWLILLTGFLLIRMVRRRFFSCRSCRSTNGAFVRFSKG